MIWFTLFFYRIRFFSLSWRCVLLHKKKHQVRQEQQAKKNESNQPKPNQKPNQMQNASMVCSFQMQRIPIHISSIRSIEDFVDAHQSPSGMYQWKWKFLVNGDGI